MVVLVLGLAGGHLDERLLQLVDGAQDALDALDLAGAPVGGLDRAVSVRWQMYQQLF